MSFQDPFPTVTSLMNEMNVDWSGYDSAAQQTFECEKRLHEALILQSHSRNDLLDSDSELVLCGSFARHEMTVDSDYDWTMLIDGVVNVQHCDLACKISDRMAEAELIEPGSSGTFGNLVFSHDLVHRIGGGADSNANLTRRMLMLLESRPFTTLDSSSDSLVWQNVLSNVLKRYFEQDVHFSANAQCKVPRFLLNDLTRYWRTICVDYAAKHQEQNGKKWALRNAKLRLSRKLIYASGLAFCLSCELDPPINHESDLFSSHNNSDTQPFIEKAVKFAGTPCLEYLGAFIQTFVTEPTKRRQVTTLILGSYNEWLLLIGDADKRRELAGLSHEDAKTNDTFRRIRSIGSNFASGLQLLFFNQENGQDPISQLSLDYVGF